MLRFLLNFWLFQFLAFFAAGDAGIADLGVGDGAGDGTGGEQIDEGGDEGVVEGEGDEQIDGEGDETVEGEEGDQGGEGEQDITAELGGRTVTAEDKQLIAAAKKLGPKALKRTKQLIFAEQRLNKVIPGGVNAAIQLSREVEQLGGVEGLQTMQDNLEAYQADENLFENSPDKWIATGFEANPDSAIKAFAFSLDFVAEHHPEQYNYYMAKVISNDLANVPIRDIYNALQATKTPENQKLAKQLAEYFNDRLATAKQVPEKKVDAAAKKLTEKETALGKKEIALRETEARTAIKPEFHKQIGGAVRAEAKARGLDLDKLAKEYKSEYIDLCGKIHAAVNQAARKDKRFLRNFTAHLHRGEVDKAVRLVNRKHAEIIGEITAQQFQNSGIFRGKKGAAAGGAGKPNAGGSGGSGNNNAGAEGWTQVRQKPANSEIDWNKSTMRLTIDGKYILKNGKKVIVKY